MPGPHPSDSEHGGGIEAAPRKLRLPEIELARRRGLEAADRGARSPVLGGERRVEVHPGAPEIVDVNETIHLFERVVAARIRIAVPDDIRRTEGGLSVSREGPNAGEVDLVVPRIGDGRRAGAQRFLVGEGRKLAAVAPRA